MQRFIREARRVGKRALSLAVAVSSVLLQGCGALGVQADWHDQPSHPPLPPYHVQVAEKELQRACGEYPGMRLYGCAVRLVSEKVCLIYTGPNPAAWLMEHERKHCAGWDHGPRIEMAGNRATATSAVLAAEPGAARHAH